MAEASRDALAFEAPTAEAGPDVLAFEAPTELSQEPPSMTDFVDKQHPLLRIRPTSGESLIATLQLPPAAAFSGRPVYRWNDEETLDLIKWEVAHLRSGPLNGMISIDDPVVPRMAVDQRGDAKLIANGIGPPWAVYARLSGAKGGPYYVPGGVRVRLLLDGAYPASPPEVHFMQTLHHFFLDNDNGLPQIFYELLSDTGDAERHSLRSTLLLCRILLQAPLHPCEGCNANFAAFSRMHDERLETIAAYATQHKHAGFFDGEWRREWLAPELREALAAADGSAGDGSDGDGGAALDGVLRELNEGVYCFPMLTEEACAMLVEEVDGYNASGLPTSRPNSMNKYGLVLNEIGMEPLFDELQRTVLQRVAERLFPREGASLDRHHSFVVQYEQGKDLGLDMHVDNSDVTFNVCLGREFTGATLSFCGYMGEPHHRHLSYTYEHVRGHCVVHLGRRRHGADDIASGERMNLIVWNHNLAYRSSRAYSDLQQQKVYKREAAAPDAVCLSYTHDRDYLQYKEPPPQHKKMTRRAWCPPLFARHDAPDPDRPATLRQRVIARSLAADDDDSFDSDSAIFDDDDGSAARRPARSGALLEALESPSEEAGIDTLLELQSEVQEILREAAVPVPEEEALPPAYSSLLPASGSGPPADSGQVV